MMAAAMAGELGSNDEKCGAEENLRDALHQIADSIGADGGNQGKYDRIEILEKLLGRNVCERLGIYRFPEGFLLSVVVPVFNEVDSVEEVVRRVRATGIPCEIILVDDGSTDGTRELLESWRDEADLVVHLHAENAGKGASLKTGFRHAKGDIVVVQDADLEYDPADFWALLLPIIKGQADVVYGSRFTGRSQRASYFLHFVGNRIITLLSNFKTNLNLSDIETCYKAFRREVIHEVAPKLREQRFGIEPELTARLAKIPNLRIFEVPISYDGRTYAEGKKIGWRDGLRALWCILRY